MPMHGIVPACITPMTQDGAIDEEGLARVLNFQIESGVHGVFTVGSTGEAYALTSEEKRRIYRLTVKIAGRRVPVMLGTGTPSTRETIELTAAAAEAGADAVSVITPYFISPNDEELFAHFKAIADAVEIPILLYSNPERAHVCISPAVISRLADACENVVGIKDSSGDLTLTMEYLEAAPAGFRVMVGRDTLIYAGLDHGAVGSVAATGNVFPEILVEIYEKYRAGDHAGALAAQRRLAPLRLAFGLGTFPSVVKAGVEWRGLPAGPPRAPVQPLPPEKLEKLGKILKGVQSGE